ncbi:MAG TPA: SDR family NAD(P)-dependent oxidoreductase [Cytophagales bacterium]|nr:SDR family NAD(P)-dependent oxidoreductase [Cytophagales bacterium]
MLKNNTILITGGGSGIGAALALQLALNNKVYICGRDDKKLKAVADQHANISYAIADLCDYGSIEQLFDKFKESEITFDVLFNNAGVVEIWDLRHQTLAPKEIFDKVSTNLSGAIAVTQQFVLQANPSVENLIVNNTSEIAIMPIPVLPLYSATKAALSVFTKALRVQFKHTSFKVVELLTPGVDTDMPKKLNNTGKLRNTEDFAKSVIAHISKGNTEYAPGKNVLLLKVLQKFFPNSGLNLIDKLSRKQLLVGRLD